MQINFKKKRKTMQETAEHIRLKEHHDKKANWKKWGPYLSERAWGTVREDYSENGDAWEYFPHEIAHSRTYRWNEDGIGGICDRNQHICLSFAFWNGKDPLLKERMFGLSGPQGNHGEDVKEYYFYLDNTPTHSYMEMLYKYPQEPFPYEELVLQNQKRGTDAPEYELIDTGAFSQNKYFDIFLRYAKAGQDDILVSVAVHNRGKESAECLVLPTVLFRNTWSWGYPEGPTGDEKGKPLLKEDNGVIVLEHPVEGTYYLYSENSEGLLFTDNETNFKKLYNTPNTSAYVKDAFHQFFIQDEKDAVSPKKQGTKACSIYKKTILPEAPALIRLRLSKDKLAEPFKEFDAIFALKKKEADLFYEQVQNQNLSDDMKKIQRTALSGMLWNKQFYYFDVEQWLKGDPASPPPPKNRTLHRNREWEHISNFDILSLPDKWEYPYFCSWDSAFHCIPFLFVDSDYAKRQLTLMTREWYMHPNGQLAAYEWSFSDVNPPVHAWATWRCYKIDAKIKGKKDIDFLKGIFHKLLLNFTWWVNKKDSEGNNVFQGGFLGMDNISVFDRSTALPTGGHIDQSDATSWMAFYCVTMMKIALELSMEEPIYQDIATKFFEHFIRISNAINGCSNEEHSLWDPEDKFYYDALHLPNEKIIPLRIRSLVGLLPLLAVETLSPELLEKTPVFSRRLDWFSKKKAHITCKMACMHTKGSNQRRIMSIVMKEKLVRILQYMLDENEFLSPYGIRSVSKFHEKNPYHFPLGDQKYSISYEPGYSKSRLFGGNSNWRGPIWFPINFLLIEALQKYHHYFGDDFQVEFPSFSGNKMNLWDISIELSKRLIGLFVKTPEQARPIYGSDPLFEKDPHWKDLVLFHEYFHGDTGLGLGSTHQTGWTGLVAKLIQQSGEFL